MARAPKRKTYTSPDVGQLETDVRLQETIYLKVTSILVEGGATIGVHDNRNEVPPNSLVLREDPAGNMPAPEGTTPLFKGKAIFGGKETNVAAFRRT